MKIYKLAEGETEEVEGVEGLPEEKEVNTGIYYLGTTNVFGAIIVQFQIRGTYYIYRLSFPDQAKKVQQIARHSGGKALAYAKKYSREVFEVTRDWPRPGSIIREVE